MIIEEVQSDVITIGNIQKNSVSIDPDNIDFIISILSTNLYSYPIESFIRETVSNAWDSHVEAGVTSPVIIELGKDINDNYFCSIRDNGVGLSPERFEKIYRNIGSSTKRDDNEQIGGYGIGRFSALAASDTVFITSCFEGIKYSYIMYKENNKLNIDLLSSVNTGLPNGVEVRINIKSSKLSDYSRAIVNQLCYFDNIYFETSTLNDSIYNGISEKFNGLVIKRYNNFYVNTQKTKSEVSLILGKVRYPIRLQGLNKVYDPKVNEFPIALNFEIGELSITPNREEIIYNTATITKIENKLDAAIEEIKDLVPDISVDTDSIDEYYNYISNKHYTTLLDDPYFPVSIETTFLKDLSFTLNGKTYPKTVFQEAYKWFKHNINIESNTKYNGTITGLSNNFTISDLLATPNRFKFAHVNSLNGITKDFIRTTFPSPTYFIRVDNINIRRRYKVLRESFLNSLGWRNFTKSALNKVFLVLFKENLKILKQTFADETFYVTNQSPTPDFLKFRKERLALNRTYKVKDKNGSVGELSIYKLRRTERYNTGYKGLIEDSVTISLDSKKNKKLFIYSTKEKYNPLYNLYEAIYGSKSVVFCRINPKKEKFIINNQHFIHVDNIFKMKHKHLRDFVTAQYILDALPEIGNQKLRDLFNDVSKETYDDLTVLYSYVYKFKGYVSDEKFKESLYKYGVENNLFNLEMKAKFELLLPKLKKIVFITDVFKSNYLSDSQRYFFTDYLLSRKVLRPDLKAVKDAKSFIQNYATIKN